MALSPSAESASPLTGAERDALAAIARAAVSAAAEGRAAPPVELAPAVAERLRAPGACFVTLHAGEELRGCIGSLEARGPLADDVAANARAAALDDFRFAPVAPGELAALAIEISVLSPREPLPARSRAELLARLRPGVDGLVVRDGSHRATFLPAVWEQLPDPHEFLAHLERKAGLEPGSWSPARRFERYGVESFAAGLAAEPG